MKTPVRRKRLNHLHAVFTADNVRCSHYNVTEGSDRFPFSWFRTSDAKNKFLIDQGAFKVAESFENGKKVLFTGMRRVGNTLWWEGNRYENGKRSLILFRFHKERKYFDVYLFRNYYPAAEAKRDKFIWLFLYTREKEMSETHASDISNVQSNTGMPTVCNGKDSSNL